MKALSFAICALMAGVIQPANATTGNGTGNGMKETCLATTRDPIHSKGRSELADASYCLGFMKAILFVGEHLEDGSKFCPPGTVTVEQAVTVFLKYLNENPESGHFSAESLAVTAFQQAWPCK